jgi:flagellar motility protein MotE (MotC chaperone)
MRTDAPRFEALPAAWCAATLGVVVIGTCVACPLSASAQGDWDPVVATVKAAAQPKRAAPKRAQPSTPVATGSIPVPTKPAAPDMPTVGPAFESFMARTKLAVQQQAAPAATQPPRQQQHADPQDHVDPHKATAEAPVLTTSAARQYCVNIANLAADRRFAWQKKKLLEIAQELEMRVGLLEEKITEYRQWVTRRDVFLNKASESLVLIYSRMRAESAAQQLVAMDEETAAAVLLKLDPRVSSTILNEMEPGKAARLTATISGAAKETQGSRSTRSARGGGKS